MEANLKVLLYVSILLLTIPNLSISLENEEESCPESVVRECQSLGRQPCSGKEHICGDCMEPGYEPAEYGKCTLVKGEDLPGDIEDRVADLLAGQQTDENTAKRGEDESGGTQAEQLVREAKETQATIESEESHPKPFTGDIVLQEWQFMLIVGGCILLAVVGVAIAFYCCYRIQTATKDAEAEYPSYGVTGPGAALSGDRKLAQSAQMYHYQHQKQQMIAMQKREKGESAEDASDYDSEEENEDGDLTVYECPGLAPTGEMQVKNPLFSEEQYKEATPPPAEEKQ